MALADSVPGVSGGTIAFIMGFYDEFIGSVSAFLRGTKKEKQKALKFLIKLGLGWVIGMGLAVSILTSVFEKNIYAISSMFIGFILASFPIIIREERDVVKSKYKNLFFLVLGIALVVLITILNPTSGSASSGAFHLTFFSGIYLFLAGAIAICAMVLPGISGSTLLLIFGLYMTVIGAVHDVFSFNLQEGLPICIVFGFGVLTGIFCIIEALKKCLTKYRSQTIYAVLGLMIGSFYAIIRGPESLDTPKAAMTIHTFNFWFFLIGVSVIVLLQVLKFVMERKHVRTEETVVKSEETSK